MAGLVERGPGLPSPRCPLPLALAVPAEPSSVAGRLRSAPAVPLPRASLPLGPRARGSARLRTQTEALGRPGRTPTAAARLLASDAGMSAVMRRLREVTSPIGNDGGHRGVNPPPPPIVRWGGLR